MLAPARDDEADAQDRNEPGPLGARGLRRHGRRPVLNRRWRRCRRAGRRRGGRSRAGAAASAGCGAGSASTGAGVPSAAPGSASASGSGGAGRADDQHHGQRRPHPLDVPHYHVTAHAHNSSGAKPGRVPLRKQRRKKKAPTAFAIGAFRLARQRPTLPHGNPCSTIGSEELDFRVRDGIGYGLFDIATGNFWASVSPAMASMQRRVSLRRARYGFVRPRASARSARTPGINSNCALEGWSSRTAY